MASQREKYRCKGHELNDEFFNTRLFDIDIRLVDLEQRIGQFSGATGSLIERGLQLVQEQVRESVSTILQTISDAQGQFDGQIEAVDAALQQIGAAISAAEEAVAGIEQLINDIVSEGNLPASGVVLSPIDGLSADNVQDGIAGVVSALSSKANADGSNITGRLGGNAQDISGGDWNNADQTGFYTHGGANPAANAPLPSTSFYGLTIRQGTNFILQLAWERDSSAPRHYLRVKGGSWNVWHPLPRRFATQGEAEAGTAQDVAMAPLSTAQAIAAQAAAKAHTHAQSDITGLATDLAAKVPTSRSVSTSGLASGGGDLSADRTITVSKASASEFRTGTEDGKALTPKGPWDAAAIVALTDAGTITVNMANFINAEVTLGGNRTLGNPSNPKPGQSGTIYIVQDGTGGRTLAFSSYWKFAGGTAPSLTTAPGSVDALHYKVRSSTWIECVLSKNVK